MQVQSCCFAFWTYFCRFRCYLRIFKSLAFASRNCSATPEVEGHSSAESTLFVTQRNISRGYLVRLLTLYNFNRNQVDSADAEKDFRESRVRNSAYRASSILKAVPVSEDSKEYALCK